MQENIGILKYKVKKESFHFTTGKIIRFLPLSVKCQKHRIVFCWPIAILSLTFSFKCFTSKIKH